MKNGNKGFFLAETIVVIALVTTVMAFVYPNVSKLYETYRNRTYYYDQTEDVYALRTMYDYYSRMDGDNNLIAKATKGTCDDLKTAIGNDENPNPQEYGATKIKGENLDTGATYSISFNRLPTAKVNGKQIKIFNVYLVSYMESPTSSNYNFNRYLKSLKKSTYDPFAYRLIGVFKSDDGTITRYASIKIDNPNPNRICNVGGQS